MPKNVVAFSLCVALCAAAGSAGAGEVTCREHVVEFREERDVFSLPWKQPAKAFCTNGTLRVEGRQKDVCVVYAAFPGPRPFRGPRTVRLVTEGASGGEAALSLRHRDSGKVEKRKAAWGDVTEFRFDLPPDGMWQFQQLSLYPAKTTNHAFALKSLDAFVASSPAAALRFDVETGSPLHITTSPDVPVFTVENGGDRELSFEAAVTARNYFGDEVSKPVKGTLPAGGRMSVPVGISRAARTHGIWRATCVVACEGGVATNETRFAILNPNPATPRLPRGTFKMGINYHMALYSPEDVRLTLDALNACGAKLVRAGGFNAAACWKEPERLDFSRADALMRALKERGLSLNCGCWPNPDWMVSPEDVKKGYRHYIHVRTKPGLMGEYVEKLAAHFGNDIDYIETSNEADLWRTNHITAAEYVEYQKEVYAGVKRGCKDIRVLTSAWATADSSNPMVRRKGFQEQVMQGAKGYYDVHPIHQHSAFAEYEHDTLTKFFPMRERLGINVPWYANETALTGVNDAEDGVARNVWMKILWSWAHGSTDYIWYNLRATGWKPSDPEQWYGLITADYYPRAGYAAFSSLAHAVSGLDFVRIVREGKGRHLYHFKGARGGVRRHVLAGWDGFTDPPHRIPVKTDAARALMIDLMGNVRPAETCADGFVFGISKMPGALVMEGATFAEVDETAAATIPPPNIPARTVTARVAGRQPDWHLFKWWHVRELYAGNPETVERTWKGPDDLSVKIWLGREEDALRVKFEVRDDKHVQHAAADCLYRNDGLQFIVESPSQSGNFEFGLAMAEDGRPLVYTWIAPTGFAADAVTRAIRLETSRTGDRTVYDARIPFAAIGFDETALAAGFRFNAIVYDDDGLGDSRDCWIEIVPGIARKKDYSDSPFVKIEE